MNDYDTLEEDWEDFCDFCGEFVDIPCLNFEQATACWNGNRSFENAE